jgi:DNA adenine methylase
LERTSVAGIPFLKWPGGKRWVSPQIGELVNQHLTRTYYEPFVGGGAVFFHLVPDRAVLSDINEDLINTYHQVKEDPIVLLDRLRSIPVDESTYNAVRRHVPDEPVGRAVRFLYLNRTAFGGIYRLNRRGEFNVPFGGGGRTPRTLERSGLLLSASHALQRTELRVCDFQTILNEAGQGDVVFCDPTYTVTHDNNGFRRYNEKVFSWADQERLARAAYAARGRGACVLVSNAAHQAVRELYPNAFHIILQRRSRISRSVAHRRNVSESLFVLAPD